jgi:hypothetical protein
MHSTRCNTLPQPACAEPCCHCCCCSLLPSTLSHTGMAQLGSSELTVSWAVTPQCDSAKNNTVIPQCGESTQLCGTARCVRGLSWLE